MRKNPFEYEAANNLPFDDILDFYIEDYNFSRFLQSTKNIFLIGERGSGKTMTLLYNSLKVQIHKMRNLGEVSFNKIGVHIPCNTPLFHKKEYLLIEDEYRKSIICEHYLVLSIMYYIADTLAGITELEEDTKRVEKDLYSDVQYYWNVDLERDKKSFFHSICKYINKEIIATQRLINDYSSNAFYENSMSFASSVIPFLSIIKQIDALKNSHFMLMFDDAHDMNDYQIKSLNSWIAFRDHSTFSFKVATTKVFRPRFITSTGGSILEGHDFITVDMEQPFQNADTSFYKLSENIIKRRLEQAGINSVSVDDFFPQHESIVKELHECKEVARLKAIEKYGDNASQKQIDDFVYKYHRAIYFKNRHGKANRPPYSGFETIVDISTGIVRNLLDPCYWMYDAAMDDNNQIYSISPSTQTKIIISRSERLWDVLRRGLDKVVENCSSSQGRQIYQLFDHLMILFSKRLKSDLSEPRAIVFSISEVIDDNMHGVIQELLNIARQAQYLYIRVGNAKERGRQEIYYVPNRMLFPSRGLDPHGQYSRVSLKLQDIYDAAINNKAFPLGIAIRESEVLPQLNLEYDE